MNQTSITQSDLAARQFGQTASAYLTSAVHAQGADLERMATLVRSLGEGIAALDLGCGAGHTAFAMARGGARVTACDLSQEMLDVVANEAKQRGHATLCTTRSPAERLPFANASF